MIAERNLYKKERRVDQLDLRGNIIKTFQSATDASLETGVRISSIVSCCRRYQNTAGGFIWRYNNSETRNLRKEIDDFMLNINDDDD